MVKGTSPISPAIVVMDWRSHRNRECPLDSALQTGPGFGDPSTEEPWISDPQSSGRGLIPLRVQLIGGTGLAVFADYPRGTSYDAASNVMGKPHVYTGRVEFDVAVEQMEKLTGRPLLAVTFQACSGTECQLPRTVELDIAIDAA